MAHLETGHWMAAEDRAEFQGFLAAEAGVFTICPYSYDERELALCWYNGWARGGERFGVPIFVPVGHDHPEWM